MRTKVIQGCTVFPPQLLTFNIMYKLVLLDCTQCNYTFMTHACIHTSFSGSTVVMFDCIYMKDAQDRWQV